MTRMGMVLDSNTCIGCLACSVACKVEHGSAPGLWLAPVVTYEIGSYPDDRRVYIPMMCMHCETAPCLEACPTSAIRRRPDGIVEIDPSRCCGSGACVIACPNGAITLPAPLPFLRRMMPSASNAGDVATVAAQKCDLCARRIDTGQLPACVEACTTSSRIFGDLDDPSSAVAQRLAAQETVPLPSAVGHGPRVHYVTGGPQKEAFDELLKRAPTPQLEWGAWHALEFTLLGAGAGLGIVVPLLSEPSWLDVIAATLVLLGGLVLLSTLPRPLAGLGAIRNLSTSWISRGVLADLLFVGLASLAGAFALAPLSVMALGAAIVVMLYPALAMRALPPVPSWHGGALPSSFALDALAVGLALSAFVSDDRPLIAGSAVLAALARSAYARALTRRTAVAFRRRDGIGVLGSSGLVILAAVAMVLGIAYPASIALLAAATLLGSFSVKVLALRAGTRKSLTQ